MVLFLNIFTAHQHRELNLLSFSHNWFLLCEACIFSKNVWYKQETYFIFYSEKVLALFLHCNTSLIFKRNSKREKSLERNLIKTSLTLTVLTLRYQVMFPKWCEELNGVKNILKLMKNFPWFSLRTVDFIHWIRISNSGKDKDILRGNPGASPYSVAYWLDRYWTKRYWTMTKRPNGHCWQVLTLKGPYWE